ncbi:MAG: hypothetical protein ABR999_09020 [Methanoregula sp.]|jgi:hypothetical protein|uniref:hypothetical protein n=1 Tax=Methanoregula sp. TaxID=2052170 RepID=UPI003D102639
MIATITDVEERTDFSDLKHPKAMIVVRYSTDAGTTGSLEMPKANATPDLILKAVSDDANRVHSVVGKTTK